MKEKFKDVLGNKFVLCTRESEVPDDNSNIYLVANEGLLCRVSNSIGRFWRKVDAVPGLPKLKDTAAQLCFERLPIYMLDQAITFFRDVHNELKAESMVRIYENTKANRRFVKAPPQEVSGGSVDHKDDSKDLIIMDIHSHGSMSAFFSRVDDTDENALRLFGVVGNLGSKEIETKFRLKFGEFEAPLELSDIFNVEKDYEYTPKKYPKEWRKAVSEKSFSCVGQRYHGRMYGGEGYVHGWDEDGLFGEYNSEAKMAEAIERAKRGSRGGAISSDEYLRSGKQIYTPKPFIPDSKATKLDNVIRAFGCLHNDSQFSVMCLINECCMEDGVELRTLKYILGNLTVPMAEDIDKNMEECHPHGYVYVQDSDDDTGTDKLGASRVTGIDYEIICPKCGKTVDVSFGLTKVLCSNCGTESEVDFEGMEDLNHLKAIKPQTELPLTVSEGTKKGSTGSTTCAVSPI